MARTPLMRALQQLANDHTQASKKGSTVEEIRSLRYGRMNRRELLRDAGVLATGVTLASAAIELGRATTAKAETTPRIAIIGAGISGLNAALTLRDAGYASTIYEASAYVGGRMHSDTRTWANRQTSEWCGELIDTSHTAILRLTQRFNLPLVDLRGAQPKGAEDTYFFFGKYYQQKNVDRDFQPVNQILQKQLQDAPFPTLYNNNTSTGQSLDHLSVYDWIERYVKGGHSSNMGQLLDVAYTIEYGSDTKDQSSLNLIYLLGSQPSQQGFSIFGSSDERYHISGGNQRLPHAIATSLPTDSLRFNWRMVAIARNKDASITVTFTTPKGCQQKTFDRVILTLPFSVLRTLDYSQAGFDTLKKTAITQLGYGTNSKLQLQFDTRYWNKTGAWPGVSNGNIYTDIGFQNTWDVTRGQPGSTGIIVNYTGGTIGASFKPPAPYLTSTVEQVQDYAHTFLHKLDQVWPGIRTHYNGRATLSCPWIDPNLQGSYSYWRVGQYTQFSGYEGVRQGKIHFAGEHCSTNYQGFMEGAAEEGARAANEILSDYKKAIYP